MGIKDDGILLSDCFFLFYALRASFDWLWAALMEVVGKRGATDFIGRFLVSVVASDL